MCARREMQAVASIIVQLVRMELRQQVQQLDAANEALKSRNETLSADVARLNVSGFVSLLLSKYQCACCQA